MLSKRKLQTYVCTKRGRIVHYAQEAGIEKSGTNNGKMYWDIYINTMHCYLRWHNGRKCCTRAVSRSDNEPLEKSARNEYFRCSCCRSRPLVVDTSAWTYASRKQRTHRCARQCIQQRCNNDSNTNMLPRYSVCIRPINRKSLFNIQLAKDYQQLANEKNFSTYVC